MAVINRKSDYDTEVLLHIIEKDKFPLDQTSTRFFHKKIHGSIDLTDYKLSAHRLKSAKEEISELIY